MVGLGYTVVGLGYTVVGLGYTVTDEITSSKLCRSYMDGELDRTRFLGCMGVNVKISKQGVTSGQ